MTRMLTRHRDIQNWVTDRQGVPAISRVRDRFGDEHARLRLSFERRRRPPQPALDEADDMTPCSWTAWLAELDRQHLALRVDPLADDFELVERRGLN